MHFLSNDSQFLSHLFRLSEQQNQQRKKENVKLKPWHIQALSQKNAENS